MKMEKTYDFIIVGAGPSGATLASRLANLPSAPSILLLEAGGSNIPNPKSPPENRYKPAFDKNSPLNWTYKTVPQDQLSGQKIDYSRGRGLGGSTAINFCGWTVGPSDDWEEWSEIVGDEMRERFRWENVKRVLKRIENLDPKIPDPRFEETFKVEDGVHSTTGAVNLCYGSGPWVPEIHEIFSAAEHCNMPLNPDVNSGNPLGWGVGSVSMKDGRRVTASDAYLTHIPANLRVETGAHVARVLSARGEKKVTGVELVDGQVFTAKKEVILSAGAINTPQILMLSGIGPRSELETHGIPILHEMSGVGKNLQDHCFVGVGIVISRDEDEMDRQKGKEEDDADVQVPTPMAWIKLPTLRSTPEYSSLPERVKRHIDKPTVPTVELIAHYPPTSPTAKERKITTSLLTLHPQSHGTITLSSSSPLEAPLCNPAFLTHPFDRRVLTEGLREIRRLHAAPVYAEKTVNVIGPKAEDGDEVWWEWVRKEGNVASSWHMSGTAKMGRTKEHEEGEDDAVVDNEFKVFGMQGLRVVDLSVCPFVVSAHTQVAAYVLGEIGAEVLAETYKLGEVGT